MRRRTSAKLAILVALGICSSLTTSLVIDLGHPTKAAQVPNDHSVTTVQMATNAPAAALNAMQNGGARIPTVASFRMRGMDVAMVGDVVRVSAAVWGVDNRPSVSYIWTLRVYDTNGTAVLEQHYDKQVFSPPVGQEMTPTFDDAFQLAPGRYKVSLTLYELSRAFGVEKLKASDAKTAVPQRLVSANRDITVGL